MILKYLSYSLSLIKFFSFKKIKKNLKKNDSVLCVLDGPSLNKDLRKKNLKKYKSIICANSFCNNKLFKVLKPKDYVFVDNQYWNYNASSEFRKKIKKITLLLNKKTGWKMNLWLPNVAKSSFDFSLIKNQNIIIKFYNSRSAHAGYDNINILSKKNKYTKIENFLLKHQVIFPPTLNASMILIYLSITFGSRKIDVAGLSFDWWKSYFIDGSSKNFYCFYQNNKKKVIHYNDKVKKVRGTFAYKLNEIVRIYLYFDKLFSFCDYTKTNVYILNKNSTIKYENYSK